MRAGSDLSTKTLRPNCEERRVQISDLRTHRDNADSHHKHPADASRSPCAPPNYSTASCISIDLGLLQVRSSCTREYNCCTTLFALFALNDDFPLRWSYNPYPQINHSRLAMSHDLRAHCLIL